MSPKSKLWKRGERVCGRFRRRHRRRGARPQAPGSTGADAISRITVSDECVLPRWLSTFIKTRSQFGLSVRAMPCQANGQWPVDASNSGSFLARLRPQRELHAGHEGRPTASTRPVVPMCFCIAIRRHNYARVFAGGGHRSLTIHIGSQNLEAPCPATNFVDQAVCEQVARCHVWAIERDCKEGLESKHAHSSLPVASGAMTSWLAVPELMSVWRTCAELASMRPPTAVFRSADASTMRTSQYGSAPAIRSIGTPPGEEPGWST